MPHIDKEVFEKNLLLTQAYCDLQLQNSGADVTAILRSYHPIYNDTYLFSDTRVPTEGYYNERFSMTGRVNPLDIHPNGYNELFYKQLQHKNEKQWIIPHSIDIRGRILVAEIDQTPIDGASEALSEGFIDGNDCPPIDTWFYKSEDDKGWQILYAWVPEQFIHLTQNAIDVNCVDCLSWYDDYILKRKAKSSLAIAAVDKATKKRKANRFINWIKGR